MKPSEAMQCQCQFSADIFVFFVVQTSENQASGDLDAMTMMSEKQVDLVYIAPRLGSKSEVSEGYKMRRAAVDYSLPIVTNSKIFELLVASLHKYDNSASALPCTSIDEHYKMSEGLYL